MDLLKSSLIDEQSSPKVDRELIYKIRGCAFEIRNAFGRFLHERPYQMAMEHAMREIGMNVSREVPIHVFYNGKDCGRGFSVDILLHPNIVIELKATLEMQAIHFAQLRNYMNLLHSPFGVLINFGVKDFKTGIHVMTGIPSQFPKHKAYPILNNNPS